MSMPERVCEGCGAINRADADLCWRCRVLLVSEPLPVTAEQEPSPAKR